MSRTRLLTAAALLALLALAAWVGVRALLRPDPYVTLARPADGADLVVGAPGPAAGGPAPVVGEPGAPVSPREAPSEAVLRAALRAVDRVRAAGYADPVAADPDEWAVRSCACHAVDVRRLRALAGRGLALRRHRTSLVRVVVARAGPASAQLLVTDRLGAYAAVDARGRIAARWPASGARTWRVTLVRAGGRWLLGAVARAP